MRLLIIINFLICLSLYAEVEVTFPVVEKTQDNAKLYDFGRVNSPIESLEPIQIEDVLVYYRGAHFYGVEIQNPSAFDKIKEGMSLGEIVSLLGTGSQNKFEGIGFITWRCEDGRVLKVWPSGQLKDEAEYFIELRGESQRTKDVKQLAESLISRLEISGQNVSVALTEDTYQAKAGELKTYSVGQTFQKTDPLPRIDFRITKIEERKVYCWYFYQAQPEGLLRYSETGNLILTRREQDSGGNG